MSGFITIPDAALAAVGREGRLAVLDLFERGWRVGYGWMSFTDREKAEEWAVSRREVWRILESLEQAGCVEVERAAPGSRRPSRVRAIPVVSQNGSQNGSQNRPVRNSRIPVREPDPEPDPEPSRGEVFARALLEDQIRSSSSGDRAREADPATVDELVRLQASDEPTLGPPTERDRQALQRELLLGVPVEHLRLLWAWSGLAPEADACRTGRWRRWGSLLKPPLCARRLEEAVRWDAAGRPTATGPPSRASPRVALKPARPWDPPPAPPPDPSEAEPLDEADLAQLRAWGIPVPDPEDPPS